MASFLFLFPSFFLLLPRVLLLFLTLLQPRGKKRGNRAPALRNR
ncbi:hypothetical protein SLEP1_g18960 [Rubroshorea leprosula]|uniref:Uncharacterized protein n=1 Tax=Rubroshorea leprosula TaxID=152421 RepID=A0AAV5J4Q9_9ROSI|nr:hypothetical protein SLEP1_g18960 [Rubroshorea leprosula]